MKPSFSDINIINIDQQHLLGRVHSTVSGSVVDGPGIRYVIFLQGCQFQCVYCHNRDTWDMEAGKLYTVSEIMEDLLPYVKFFDASRGGVTVSGGEALLQPDFVALLFSKLKQMNVHTCLDTNGYVTKHLYGEKIEGILKNTDLVMLDIKHINNQKHKALTGISNEYTLNFARYLSEINHPTRIRYVVIPGDTDDDKDLNDLAKFVKTLKNIERVELLPYHKMGKEKWESMGVQYPLNGVEPPSNSDMRGIKTFLEEQYDFTVLL